MRTFSPLAMASGLVAAAGAGGYLRFRRKMKAIRARLEAGSRLAPTNSGPIEYGREGAGRPILLIHGAGGGYDQGLMLGRDLFAEAGDVIAPSRFGYLRTPLPADGSPAAQADAHAALLDALDIPRAVVVGVSAGAPSALEMALRHKDRVSALILVVPRLYAPSDVVRGDASAPSRAVMSLFMQGADFAYWLAARFARASLVRFLGVRPELEAKAPAEERERVTAIIGSMSPLPARIPGLRNDGGAEIGPAPLETVAAPTLIVSAPDDLFNTLPGARYTAERIPGAELLVLEDGGHLMLGHGAQVRDAIAAFLSRHPAAAHRDAA